MIDDGRQRVSTGSPFEPIVGISRAIRAGNLIAVTGTASLGPDGRRRRSDRAGTSLLGDHSGRAVRVGRRVVPRLPNAHVPHTD